MDSTIINRLFSQVKPGDTLYLLGDIALNENALEWLFAFTPKGVDVHLILGNHDKIIRKNKEYQNRFKSVSELKTITVEKQPIVLCHYMMGVWDRSHYGSWGLYGHCMDLETEILTKDGWKFRKDIVSSNQVLTLNLNTGFLEYNHILEIIDYPKYCGGVISAGTHSTNFRVTNKHAMIDRTRYTNKFRKL